MADKTKVFIGGSRRLSRLNNDLKRRLDNIIKKGLTVIIGDANGADKAVQRYLADKRYDKVIVFSSAGGCRNNIANWPSRAITGALGARGFAYYAAKDRAMAGQADYGLMLWDGHSRGTLTNIVDLVQQGKPVLVYLTPERSFATLRGARQLAEWLSGFDPTILPQVDLDQRVPAMAGGHHRNADAPLF